MGQRIDLECGARLVPGSRTPNGLSSYRLGSVFRRGASRVKPAQARGRGARVCADHSRPSGLALVQAGFSLSSTSNSAGQLPLAHVAQAQAVSQVSA